MTAAAPPTGIDTSMSNSTVVRPYPAVTPTSSSIGSATACHLRDGAQVDVLDQSVRLDLGDRPLGDDPACVHHGHEVRVAAHEVHVVLDDDDGPVTNDPLQQLAGRVALVCAHPCDGLVEEHHLCVLHQQHAYLQPLLLSVSEVAGGAVRQLG